MEIIVIYGIIVLGSIFAGIEFGKTIINNKSKKNARIGSM
jgi:hypothetical protein